jgi:hypothetical protein
MGCVSSFFEKLKQKSHKKNVLLIPMLPLSLRSGNRDNSQIAVGSVVVAEIEHICTPYRWSCQDRFLWIPMLSMILIRPQARLFQPRLPDHWPWKGSFANTLAICMNVAFRSAKVAI